MQCELMQVKNHWIPAMITKIRTYSELVEYETFKERFRYLSLRGNVAEATFGFDRYINQGFYRSRQWKQIRYDVIARDLGCDLGVAGYEIHDQLTVHHMNPMSVEDIVDGDPSILDPEFLITTTHQTHNAIHYGDERQLPQPFVERRPGDTKLW
jgi:hypothetical protein